MALFDPEFSRCALCGGEFVANERPFATPDGALDGFESYADAVFHWQCVAKWSEQKAFAQAVFDSERESVSGNPYWHIVYDDDGLLVCVNPDLGEPHANVVLSQTGSLVEVPLTAWSSWLRGEGGPEAHHAIEGAVASGARETAHG